MSVAQSYAKALFESIQENGNGASLDRANLVESQLGDLLKIFDESQPMKRALYAPIISQQEKTALIQEISSKIHLDETLTRFLILLTRKGRLPVLNEIRDAFRTVRLSQSGGLAGRLEAAEPLSEADLESLVKAFSEKFGKKVTFQVSVDPSLLAGIKVTVNGVTYDGTLRSQIQKLRDQFVFGNAGAQTSVTRQ